MKPVTPEQAMKYYVALLFIIMVILVVVFSTGCGNVSVPELNTGVTSPSLVPPTVIVSVGMVLPAVPPDPANYLNVWLASAVKGDAARTQHIDWDFGDGSPIHHEYVQPGISHVYPPIGRWTVTATVHEVTGRTTSGTLQLSIP